MATIIGRCGGGCTGIIDSTATVGDDCGVHSVGQAAGLVLTSDGADGSTWSAVGGTPQSEWFNVASLSIAGATSTQLTWTRLSGPLIMDLTVPTQPKVVDNGVYTLDVTSAVTSNATARNLYELSANLVQSLFTAAIHAQFAYSPTAADAVTASVSVTGKMFAADSMIVKILNQDTVARNFNCPSIRVTKIVGF